MTGTLINTAAILAGGTVGLLLKKGVPERFTDTITKTLGLATLVLGFAGVMAGMLTVGKGGALSSGHALYIILCLVIGAIIGELINIDKWMNKLGTALQNRFTKDGGNVAKGFVTASLIYCVGAMAIVGALQDGLNGDPHILIEKSILDGTLSVLLASSLGVGVLFSAGAVFLYQGLITVCASFLRPLVTANVQMQLSMVGSALIICIGLNLLGSAKIKTANLIPAAFLPLVLGAAQPLLNNTLLKFCIK